MLLPPLSTHQNHTVFVSALACSTLSVVLSLVHGLRYASDGLGYDSIQAFSEGGD